MKRAYDPSLPEFEADASRLTQVFLNVIRNACQAMESGGGELRVETRTALDQRLAGPDGSQLPTLLVTVTDDGPGMPADTLARLGTPFFTTRKEGTGLGIAVARHWVTRHGGMLHIESEPGLGTSARISLPLRRPRPA